MIIKILIKSLLQNNYANFQRYNCCSSFFIKNFSTKPKLIIQENVGLSINDKLLKYHENSHAHNVLRSIPGYSDTLSKSFKFDTNNMREKEFEDLLNKNWRAESASEIVKAFKTACYFSKRNNIRLSDNRFDKLVDGLMDKCQDLTDNELADLLSCLREYPAIETIESHNFQDIWSALDDVCCWRTSNWPIETLLLFADHWYLLGLARYSDYIKECIKRLSRKVQHLNRHQLVQTLFIINICRKPWDMFDFECQLEKHISKLTTEELGIVSMSFFKTQTPIKGTFLIARMVEKLLKETSTVSEITLSAILKVIRYSPHLTIIDLLQQFLNKLVPEIDRLSIVCCVHIALAGTTAQFFNPEILTKITEKYLNNMSQTRIKDIERLTFALSLFNFNPKTSKPIYQELLRELADPKRVPEIEKHPRCLASCLHFLGLQQIYPYELISQVLDMDFLKKAYGNNKRSIGREILFLDTSLTIDCPDYKGNRLSEHLRWNLTKWNVSWIPDKNKKSKFNAGDKLMLDIIETIENILGGEKYLHVDYILPHFQKADIVVCKDKQGKPVNISYLKENPLGHIMYAENNGNVWYAVIAASWNSYIRGSTIPTGILATKMRQLKKIGYIPIMVPWHEFTNLSQQQKEDYIKNKIR